MSRTRKTETLVRARVLVARDTPRDSRAGGARLGGDQRPRPTAPGRDRIATDGGWVRNFPLGAALDHPDVNLVVAFRYVPRYPHIGVASLVAGPAAAEPLPRRPAGPGLDRRARRGRGRELRGEPVHLGDMLIRLMRVAIQRNTALEERLADERDAAIRSSKPCAATSPASRRARAAGSSRPSSTCRRGALRADCAAGTVPRIAVRGRRRREARRGLPQPPEWSEDSKRALIARGYAAADAELARARLDLMERAA